MVKRKFTKYPNGYVSASDNIPNRKDIETDVWNTVCEAIENPDFHISGFDNFSLKRFYMDTSNPDVNAILRCMDDLAENVAKYIENKLDAEG